jgi:hypothetical protein
LNPGPIEVDEDIGPAGLVQKIMLKKLLMTVAVVTPLTSSANAADIRIERSADASRTPGIYIEGDIVKGDYARFKKLADRLPDGIYTVVILTSRGGLLVDGLNIGTTIRARGFSTLVGEYCMSVCAMMWLGGVYRVAASTASIGFHGAGYENGEPSIAGNALVGAYLANLGFSYKVIAALIKVGPKEMDWLSAEWAKILGIQVYVSTPRPLN